LAQRGVPLVFVNSGPRPGFTSLASGGAAYVEELVRHLIEVHGHRRIAYVGRAGSGTTRFTGYTAALEQAKIEVRPEWVIREGNDAAAGRSSLPALLDRLPASKRPTAVVAYNDLVAIGVIRAAHERGLRVPADLAIVGYDGIPLGAYLVPSLTTVAQDVHTLAVGALDALPLDAAAAAHDGAAGTTSRHVESDQPGLHVVAPAHLVFRESCGCTPAPSPIA
jgi:DNA-binding LacI/PurR family transcriptional regulator